MNIWRGIDGSEVENHFFLTLLEVPELKGQVMAMTMVIDTEQRQITIQSDSYGVQMMVLHRS